MRAAKQTKWSSIQFVACLVGVFGCTTVFADPLIDSVPLSVDESPPLVSSGAAHGELSTALQGDLWGAMSALKQRLDELEADNEELRETVETLTEDDVLTPRWDERFEFESDDRDFRFVVGARVDMDFGLFDLDDDLEVAFGPIENGTEFRRARLISAAKLFGNTSYFGQYDFSTGRVRFASVYVAFSDVPWLHNVRIGQFEEPLGLERLTSHRFTTFMERALTNAITPVRSTGVMLYDSTKDRLNTWWIGYFRESDSVGFAQEEGGDALTMRVTSLLAYCDDGRQLVHVGAAYSRRSFREDLARFRNRPESNLSSRFVDTGDIPVEHTDLFATEFAVVNGPLSLQAEALHNQVASTGSGDLEFYGYYATISYILTGEYRTYSRSSATFRRVEPKSNFAYEDGCFTGIGAWEVASRISHVDLQDGAIDGGRETNYTLGLNWYLNPHTRAMFNFVYADRLQIGEATIYQGRLQLDF